MTMSTGDRMDRVSVAWRLHATVAAELSGHRLDAGLPRLASHPAIWLRESRTNVHDVFLSENDGAQSLAAARRHVRLWRSFWALERFRATRETVHRNTANPVSDDVRPEDEIHAP
jgi:hypothetical protein